MLSWHCHHQFWGIKQYYRCVVLPRRYCNFCATRLMVRVQRFTFHDPGAAAYGAAGEPISIDSIHYIVVHIPIKIWSLCLLCIVQWVSG
jgi:hypothetical protein